MTDAMLEAIFAQEPLPAEDDCVSRHLGFRELRAVRGACRLALRMSRSWRMGDIWDMAGATVDPGRLAHWLDTLDRQSSELARPGSHGVPFSAFDFALAARACRWAARAASRQVADGSAAAIGAAGGIADFAIDATAATARCLGLAHWQEAHEAHEDLLAWGDFPDGGGPDDADACTACGCCACCCGCGEAGGHGPWPPHWDANGIDGMRRTAAYVVALPPREPLTQEEDLARAYLGSDISDLRDERGWSQAELARRAGVSAASACRAEGGKRVNADIVARLLDALGVPWRQGGQEAGGPPRPAAKAPQRPQPTPRQWPSP